MFLFKGAGQERQTAVENAFTRVFQQHGYSVIDAGTVTQTVQRHPEISKRHETEAAKRFGARLQADVVVSGESNTQVAEKTYMLLEGKKVAVSQADVTAKAVLVRSGKTLAADTAHARRPFDLTGAMALQMAAEALAEKLVQGIEGFLSRDTIDYRLPLPNDSHVELQALREALQKQMPGVRQVTEQRASNNVPELTVQVAKQQDLEFKRTLQTLPAGSERFAVAAREDETIYLRPIAGSTSMPTRPEYRKSWAVVIGISDYQRWPRLDYAVNDARSVGELLRQKFAFDEVITIFDQEATRQKIKQVLGDELPKKIQTNDRVFVFFAGHGQTESLPNNNKIGYIIPVEVEEGNYYSTAISMRELHELSDRLPARHIFFALDSCFSGLLLRLRGGASDPMARTRQVMTAGSEGEKVVEVQGHGLFTKVFLTGLEGDADANRDGHITATELFHFVHQQVLDKSQNRQNPAFGRITIDEGEFVF
jgi:hypothetical protein